MQKALFLVPHDPKYDPRVSYWVQSFTSKGFDVTVLFCADDKKFSRGVQLRKSKVDGVNYVSGTAGFLALKYWLSELHPNSWKRLLIEARELNDSHSLWHMQTVNSFFNIMLIAEQYKSQSQDFDAVIGLDLQGAVAMQVFSKLDHQTFVYDAQEINPFASSAMTQNEIEWWIKFESGLLSHVDSVVTVSPGIAEWYKNETGFDLGVIPNWVPRSIPFEATFEKDPKSSESRPIRFLYYGGIAENRGIEALLELWNIPRTIATLTIASPNDGSKPKIKKYWNQKNRPDSEVVFIEKPADDNLIEWMATYDVGILPYQYKYPYSHASPNKLGQYLAANLAIFANSQEFVGSIVKKYNTGVVENFDDSQGSRNAIERLVNPVSLKVFKENSNKAFNNDLNWNYSFETWYDAHFLAVHRLTRPESNLHEKSASNQRSENYRVASFNLVTPKDLIRFTIEKVKTTLSTNALAQKIYSQCLRLIGLK
jgi:glycosyltransferase involved in cell wall biosynthesis